MLEHTSMYFSGVPQLCEDDTSLYPDFYTAGLGPYELQDPVWAKMNNLAAGVNKKRKKSDTKPQAQINKCNNEKRRREQENIYIEELAELISANFADMSSLSVKPDKCAILQETVSQIRSIKQRESQQSTDPVQQGEVSSSRPTILSNEIFGPLLLEALDGFLFVVSSEGKVEHVTENVTNYIKYTRDEVLGKSIYNFIHTGDHVRFSASLSPIPTLGWAGETQTRNRSFNCRLMVKPPDDQEETYEQMHISSTLLRDQVSGSEDEPVDAGPCLLYVASRISPRDKAVASNLEQFTTKIDSSGKVLAVDTTGITGAWKDYVNKEFVGQTLHELCLPSDLPKITAHMADILASGSSVCAIYRMKVGPEPRYVRVQTKSKHFKANPQSGGADIDFIMAAHTVLSEDEAAGPTDPGGGNTIAIGGPLMTSVVNGTRNKNPTPRNDTTSSSTSSSNNNNILGANTTSFTAALNFDNEFNFDFPSSTWELETSSWADTRPDSRQSATSVSTPRPPSAPAYSPANVAQSPLPNFVTQPSPTVPNPATPAYGGSFPFSPMAEPNFMVEEQKDTKVNVMEESGRLRNLLTKPQNAPSVDSANDAENRNKNRILKGLLNQQDEEDRSDNRSSPRANARGGLAGPSELPKTSSAGGGNNMLLQLLNEKSDDDDIEARAGIKKRGELLQQLLKDEEECKSENQSQDDTLLRSLGFSSSPSPPGEPGRPRKRPSDDRDDNPAKRSNDGSQVSSSGPAATSKLCEKNRMLASLLAKQPTNHQPIPPIPASVISATPQEKLPKITDPNLIKNNRMINQTAIQQQQNMLSNQRVSRMPGRPPATNYLNQMLTPTEGGGMQRMQTRQITQIGTVSYSSPATSSTDQLWDMQTSSDALLSDILDQVIDIVPEDNNADILNLLESIETSQNNNSFQQPISEKMAINIIQKSLMQCESVVKSPSSPTVTMPGTPPAYSSASMTTQNNPVAGFPPPLNYPRPGFGIQRGTVRAGGTQYVPTNVTNPQLILQRKQQQLQQEQHKRRLLQQQQQQQLLIPSNAAAADINSGLQNIDSILNNSVAPNVSLQRSSSVPESQLSPTYGNQMSQQNQRLGNQQPYSPHSQLASPIGQQAAFPQTTAGNYQQTAARLSPHPPYNQQLSPRQTYPQGNNQSTNWQQAQARLSVQQQQNPMLNAQLTGSYVSGPNGRGFAVQRAPQQQQQRGMGSPGTAGTRQSPYPNDSFPPPASPNSAYSQSQYLRLQRANSAPTATMPIQPPGGLGSPRPYGREHHSHPYPPIPPHPMMYQQDSSQYCYDQTGLQLTYNGADRGRAPPHLQAGVSGSGTTSEYVRQELRAVVGARTGQAQATPGRPPSQLMNQVNPDLDALGINFDMPTSGASDSPKLWGAMGSDMGSMSPQSATSRSSMEEGRQGDQKSASLLQKLLSE